MSAKVIFAGPLVVGVDEHGEAWIPGPAGASWRRARDRWCYYCGVVLRGGMAAENQPDQKTRDHITAKFWGGDNAPENIAPACRACNGAKDTEHVLCFLLRKPYGVPPKTLMGDGPTAAARRTSKRKLRRRRKQIFGHRMWLLRVLKTRMEKE